MSNARGMPGEGGGGMLNLRFDRYIILEADGPWIFFVFSVYGNTMTVFNYNSRRHVNEFL